MRIRRHVAALAAFLVAAGASVAVTVPARAYDNQNRLLVGQSTTIGLTSASGGYELFLFGDSMTLQQTIDNFSINIWGTPQHSSVLNGAKLTMQRDGNLALRSNTGRLMWTSGTAGTGSANHLTLQDNGNLVVFTSSGRAVWSSGTGAAMLRSGSVLRAGQSLWSRYDVSTPLVRLAMQPDGNLVLSYAGRPRWSTNTHVPGSRLVGMPDGNWAVYTSANRLVWNARTAVHTRTYLVVLPAGSAASLQVNRLSGSGGIPFEVVA